MTDYTPELGQMFSGSPYTETSTPGYVTAGIDAIDEVLREHLYGVRPVMRDYGTFPDYDLSAVSNSGHIHDLPGAPFSMRSYDWSDPEEYEPNFHHFESGFKAYWYKHSHRGETCNRDISSADWRKIQRECEDWVLAQPKAFRVLITGSRDFAPECFTMSEPNRKGRRYKKLRDDFSKVDSPGLREMVSALREARKAANGAHMVVVHGGASGADQLSGALTRLVDNAHTEVHPALWNRDDNGGYDKTAGFKRNERMVDSGVDLCLAFFKNGAGNRGTKHCSDLARKRGIKVMEVWSD